MNASVAVLTDRKSIVSGRTYTAGLSLLTINGVAIDSSYAWKIGVATSCSHPDSIFFQWRTFYHLNGPVTATRQTLGGSGMKIFDIVYYGRNETSASNSSWTHIHFPNMRRMNVNGGADHIGSSHKEIRARMLPVMLNNLEDTGDQNYSVSMYTKAR